MKSNAVRMFSGADSTRAAHQLLIATQDRRNDWPYVHVFPPFNADDVFKISTAFTQDPSAGQTLVLEYKVNSGKVFYLQSVLFGANVSFNPGDALFTMDRNSALGLTDTQFMPEQGLIQVPVALGSPTEGPWRLERAREFAPLDIIRIKVSNINLSVGEPTAYVCGIFGYEVPTLDVRSHR